jgi:uncharacterized protein YbjT (DUF2867 family)
MILVTGALGLAGGTVLGALRKRVVGEAARVRAMYRSGEDAKKAAGGEGGARAGVEAVVADFADLGSLRAALAGVETVYLVCGPVPELVYLESNMIDACVAAGVAHVVLNSALGAGDYGKSFPSWHRKVEDKLRGTGLAWTILRPNSFMQNITAFFAPSIRAQGAFYSSVGNARTSFIDVGDIAEVAANTLTEPGKHAGKIYELNGPEAVTYAELAERIARVAGKAVQYVDIPMEAQRKSLLERGMPAWQVEALLDLQQYYVNGQGGDVDEVLAGLLGHAPRGLDAFLRANAEAFREAGAAGA